MKPSFRCFLFFLLAAGLFCSPTAPGLSSLVPAALADEAGDLRNAQAAIEKADYGKAVSLLTPLADKGNAEALYVLGRLTLDGKGVKKSEQRAAQLFRRLPDQTNLFHTDISAAVDDIGYGSVGDTGLPCNIFDSRHPGASFR